MKNNNNKSKNLINKDDILNNSALNTRVRTQRSIDRYAIFLAFAKATSTTVYKCMSAMLRTDMG